MADHNPPAAWGDDVPLRGPDAPQNDGQIKHLIEYLLTVYKRFGNTAVTADLQWGATALHKRDAQKERIEQLERELALERTVRLQLATDSEMHMNQMIAQRERAEKAEAALRDAKALPESTQELQALYGRVQSELARRILGDPRKCFTASYDGPEPFI